MCGIVGLFIKNPELESQLGLHLSAMLIEMDSGVRPAAHCALIRMGNSSSGRRTSLRLPECGVIEATAESTCTTSRSTSATMK